MMVKICGITNREDALAAAESGASALGFNFYEKSPRYISPDAAAKLVEVLPPNILKVGVFVNTQPEIASTIAASVHLDVAQLHGNGANFPDGLRRWRALAVAADFDVRRLGEEDPGAEAFLLDAPSTSLYGGTGRSFAWRLARGAPRKVILAGGLDETNVRRAIEEAEPWGVDACSRLESAPGRKDHARLARFLKAALS